MSELSLGLLTISTKKYTEYLPDLISSASKHLDETFDYCHYIFTDDVDYVSKLTSEFPQVQFSINRIPSLGWPEATLLRYEIYSGFASIFSHDILMHLDADMFFLSDFSFEVHPSNWINGMAFVDHPGFFRPDSFKLMNLANRARIRSIFVGGYGDWETCRASAAFTPRKQRRHYFCGGAWFGLRKSFLEFCEAASRNVKRDFATGIIAKWHDESHLNYLASTYDNPTHFSSRYCYEPRFGKILRNPIILAVDKSMPLINQLQSLPELSDE